MSSPSARLRDAAEAQMRRRAPRDDADDDDGGDAKRARGAGEFRRFAYATLRALAWVVEVRSPYTGSHTAASAW